jgi:hypothetical protein
MWVAGSESWLVWALLLLDVGLLESPFQVVLVTFVGHHSFMDQGYFDDMTAGIFGEGFVRLAPLCPLGER